MYEQKPSMLTPALIGGVFLGITSAIPLLNFVNCACCALVIGGGFIAAHLYLKDYPSSLPPVSYGDAAMLGLLAGVFGGLIWTAVDIPIAMFKLQIGAGLADLNEVREALDDPNIPPAVREFLLQIISGGGLTLGIAIFQMIVNVIISVIFAALGSILGVALLQKKTPAAPVSSQGQPPFSSQDPGTPPPSPGV